MPAVGHRGYCRQWKDSCLGCRQVQMCQLDVYGQLNFFISHTHATPAHSSGSSSSASIAQHPTTTMWYSMIRSKIREGVLLPRRCWLWLEDSRDVCRERATRVWYVCAAEHTQLSGCGVHLSIYLYPSSKNVASFSVHAHNAPLRPISVGGKPPQ